MAAPVGQRGEQPVVQQPGAHRRHGAVEDRQQRALAVAVAQRARQFQAAARHLVEQAGSWSWRIRPQPPQVAEARLERLLQVEQQRAGGDEAGLVVVEAEAGQRGDAEVLAQGGAGRGRVEGPVGPRRSASSAERGPQALVQLRPGRARRARHSAGASAAQFVGEPVRRHVGGPERARWTARPRPGRSVRGRRRPTAARWLAGRGSSRSSSVTVPGVTTRVTSRRTSPLARAGSSTWSQMATRWPAWSSLREVVFECVVRKAGHRDRLVAAGQRQAEDAGGQLGVVVEESRRSRPCGTAGACPGWRSLASRYCCIIGVSRGSGLTGPRLRFAPSLRPVADHFGHADQPAAVVIGDLGHVVAHEQQAAAAGPFEVLRGRWGRARRRGRSPAPRR